MQLITLLHPQRVPEAALPPAEVAAILDQLLANETQHPHKKGHP